MLIALPGLDGFAPTPVQLADPGAAAVPPWLHGLLPPSWAEQLGSLIAANRSRFAAIVVVAGQLGDDERAGDAVAACDRVVLAARDDFDGSEAVTSAAAAVLRTTGTPIVGVAVTHTSERRASAFSDAAEAAQAED